MGKDVHGRAIRDYYQDQFSPPLLLHNSYGDAEKMPVDVFFREEEDLSTLEHLALIECRGKVLDIGAGAGVHSLILQSRDFEVHALENSAGCIEVMQQSGVEHIIAADFQSHRKSYDTILVLMNGLGLAGKLEGLVPMLLHLKSMLTLQGQILIDSSDISYLYEDTPKPINHYFGEIKYQYEYKDLRGEWFDWLYVDPLTLEKHVKQAGLKLEILMTDENDQYLAHISI